MKNRANIELGKSRLPMPALLDRLAPDWKTKNPIRADDRNPSFGAGEHGWQDHGTGDKGDQIAFLERFEGLNNGAAIRRFLELAGVEAEHKNGHSPTPFAGKKKRELGPVVEKYSYHDQDGQEIYQVWRHEPKDFSQHRMIDGEARPTMEGIPRVPYRFLEVIKAKTIIITEGERDVESLEALGYVATCNAGGAGKWEPVWSHYFEDKHIVLCGDNDDPGRRHMDQIEAALKPVATSIKHVEVPAPAKDISEYLAGMSDTEARAAVDELLRTSESATLTARDAIDLINDDALVEPPTLVAGLLHKGSTLLLGASSKSFKSWSLIDLTLSVASGAKWWDLPCTKGRVLFVDFELTPFFWRKRAIEIANKRGLPLDGIRILNCRGYSPDDALRAVDRESKAQAFDLIVIDPLYSFLAGKDENSAGDVGAVMRRLAMLAESTRAALAISHHFSKGNQSAKDSIDRFSGSGVFARFPDALLTMTRHEEEDAFTIDPTVRNFAPMKPFVLRWDHPVMVRDGSLDPANVKKPAGTFEAKYSVAQIVEVLTVESLSFGQIVAKAKDTFGMSKATVDRLLKQGQEAGAIEKINLFYRAVSRVSRS